jgi:hypothetical protein
MTFEPKTWNIYMKLDEVKNVTFSFTIMWESYCADILYYFSLMTDDHAEFEGIVNMKN